MLTLFGLFAVPAINDVVMSTLGFYRLPDEKRLAVLPIDCRGGTEQDKRTCTGMLEYIVGKLGEQDRFQSRGGIAVVPAVDIRQAGQLTVDAVRNGFGAELAIAVTASRDGDRVDYVVSVIDTSAHRQLRSAEGSLVRGEGDLLDRLIREIVELARPRDDRRSGGGAEVGRHHVGRGGVALRAGPAGGAHLGRALRTRAP